MNNEKCNKLTDKNYRKKFIENLQSLMTDYMKVNGFTSIEKACEGCEYKNGTLKDGIGIKYETYKKWITDYYNSKNNTQFIYPNFENIEKLCVAFNVSYDELLLSDKSHSRQETDLTVKRICEKTQLKESTVLCLCDNSYLNLELKRILDYLCILDKDTKRLLKLYQASEDKKEKRKIERQIQNTQVKNDNNIFDWKRRFINYLALYLFNKVTKIKAKTKNNNGLDETDSLYLFANSENSKTEVIADIYKIDPKAYESFYLERSNDYLKNIKQYYLKNDYDEEKNLYYFRKKTYATAKSVTIDFEL